MFVNPQNHYFCFDTSRRVYYPSLMCCYSHFDAVRRRRVYPSSRPLQAYKVRPNFHFNLGTDYDNQVQDTGEGGIKPFSLCCCYFDTARRVITSCCFFFTQASMTRYEQPHGPHQSHSFPSTRKTRSATSPTPLFPLTRKTRSTTSPTLLFPLNM